MDSLNYLKLAREFAATPKDGLPPPVMVNLVTNFTDDILKNLLAGAAWAQKTNLDIYAAPYRQYQIELKDPQSRIAARAGGITFVFFDLNAFKRSEFSMAEQCEEVLADLRRFAAAAGGTVVLSTLITSYQGAYGNLAGESPLFNLMRSYNGKLEALAAELPNIKIFDVNRLVHILGESRIFDQRGLFAFDIPFTHEFMAFLAEEWLACLRALTGNVKKCLVLDLDNTLWGGVVGELGPLGVALGSDYPGNAFVHFQRALLDFYNRGVLLAINSKNNPEDVAEVFAKNPHMVLKEKHFAAIRTNWNDKPSNILSIAEELNIGTDSMVFIDDDPVQRAMVQAALPEVAVPDWSMPPEEYTRALYGLNLFHQLALTNEDKQKGKMYAEERQRKQALEVAKDVGEYIASLGIVAKISRNDGALIPRLAQMTQKTNQFNLTTRRYAEHEIQKCIDAGAFVFSASVADKFGDYGTVIMAIVKPGAKSGEAILDSFLMSCRVMGRGIECAFMDWILAHLDPKFQKINTSFIPTAKNKPAEQFLDEHGFTPENGEGGRTERAYTLDLASYAKHPCQKVTKAVKIIA